jgi:signal transduction histidine kinase/predicted CoA-binding protein
MDNFLKNVPLFANLPASDLERLCEYVEEVHVPAGSLLFEEGSPGVQAYVIKEGQFEILKNSGGREVLLAVRQPGDVIGEMALIDDVPRMASVRARTPGVLLTISSQQLDQLLASSPSAARAMLHTVTSRLRVTEALLRQSEKMAQLGTLTAGVAHELNNPAAAAQRGTAQLLAAIAGLQEAYRALSAAGFSEAQRTALGALDRRAQEAANHPFNLDVLARSDREYELETWLEAHQVVRAWELAPTLVNLGYDVDALSTLAGGFQPEQLGAVVTWLDAVHNVYALVRSVGQGVARISEIVNGLKQYAYLDQAPVQSVDIHEGLDNTLSILHSKLAPGVVVRREYGPALPQIVAYGRELNQVWTNIIDNAIDAVQGQGEIVIRTRAEGQWVMIEIEDNGPGIPEAIQPKIFDPFFTTKPPGHGTGLGLNIAYNVVVQKHKGDIRVHSRPGKTTFQVHLPVNFEAAAREASAVTVTQEMNDEKIHSILSSIKTIAVVGISSHTDRPAHTVPAYLQAHGYRIIPVNPTLDEVLGAKSYPDLLAIPDPVDAVLIFRPSEAVPPMVEQAIQIGAKVVWMQEGIVNEQAAQTAQEAGLDVVMDRCMRKEHERLLG